ncbi:MAG: YibE/F family protein [Bacteroidales bacterium]
MKKRLNIIFICFVGILTILLFFLPTGFDHEPNAPNVFREKSEILEVNNKNLEKIGPVTVGSQILEMKILSGAFIGDTVTAKNTLLGQMRLDKIFRKGDVVLSVVRLSKDGLKVEEARAQDIYRIPTMLILFLLFALFLVGFARLIGLKALISFLFTGITIWKVLIPLLLKGYSPILVSLIVVFSITSVIILLVAGFSRKGLVALLGAQFGIFITFALAFLFGYLFRIPGSVVDFSEAIVYAGFGHLNLSDIFLSCIFISASGAVMDVAMDIAASQNEISRQCLIISVRDMINSGFRVAYPVIGTMTTTLLFAYSGSFMFMFMLFMAKGIPAMSILNINYVAAEVMYTLVGSFGLVLVAPITAIIGGIVFTSNSIQSKQAVGADVKM